VNVALIGAGLMGSQIGCEYALGGHSVTFLVRDVEKSRARIQATLELATDLGLVTAETAASSAIAYVTKADELHPATELVVESIPEITDLKREVLRPIAQRFTDAIIASNTSSIPLTTLGREIGAPKRVLGTHYWNPPMLMPPVEVIAGAETRPELVERMVRLIESLGKEAILVDRDVPGFIWNRLQLALLREALWLVENGVATPETVDRVVSSGMARRLRYTGPFDTIALGGVQGWTRIAANLFPVLSNATKAPADLERWLDQTPANLDAARKRRDRGLARELDAERLGN
jgi:3-hydroxybutyryl-CoA dehydrogenase